jgi:hypothetical protein
MKTFYITFVAGVLLIFFSQSTFGATPGEVYAKHSKKIIQGDINVFAGNVFFTVHSKVKKRLSDNLIFRKLKTKALNEIRSGYQHYKFPDENKLWFELYYSLPFISKFSIKNSFVVDRQIKESQAYLVLAVPEHQLSSTKINLKKIKDTVNIAFDNGSLISLIKYSRVVSGERLKKVKKEIAHRAEIRLSQERNIDKQIDQAGDVLSYTGDKFIEEDEIRKSIDCVLPLCKEINKKSKQKNKKSLNEITIMNTNELDDLL